MIIQRGKSPKDRTNGIAILPDGTEFDTIELPWKNNQIGISCIPAGHYKFMVDSHGRFQWFRILDVFERDHIEFHLGTGPWHSQGCILMTREGLNAMKWFYNDPKLKYVLEIRDE